ncbi:unnamed protein product, partial [Ascophyllum nodosum]
GLEPYLARFHRSCRRSFASVAAILESRAVLEITGVDAKGLLQGLMTNDMSLLDTDAGSDANSPPSISTAFLSSKGRVLADAIMTRISRHDGKKPLYKLRSKVKIKDTTALYDVLVMGVHDPWQVSSTENSGKGSHSPVAASSAAAAPRQPYNDGDDDRLALFEDPRSAKLGRRLIRPKAGNGERSAAWAGLGDEVVSEERYNALRMAHGVGEGKELLDSIPHESNLDLMGSISFTKGCYVGQELTARTQFKGLVRKRLLPVLFSSADELVEWGSEGSSGAAPPAPGSNILDERNGNKKKIGTLVAVSPEYNVGLALLRLSNVIDGALQGADGDAAAKTCGTMGSFVVEASPEDGERRRCVPMLPAWWPESLDATTGKVAA